MNTRMKKTMKKERQITETRKVIPEDRIAQWYELNDRGSRPGRDWEFFSSSPRPERLWGPPNNQSNG
jgi:hypothetical protein